MQKSLPQKVHESIKEHLRHKRWRRVVTALACVVVFCTTYALILPAITMTGETYCGLEEHTHSIEECYERVLICGYDEIETEAEEESTSGHTHTDACYATERVLVCKEEESFGHTHGESCYDEEGNLTCGQEEAQGHSHGNGCYLEQSVLICGLEETGETETAHQHTDDCYEEQLTCQREEHEHSLACFSNPEADVESTSYWESTLPQNLGDNLAENVVAVAKSQIGYMESTANYAVDENNAAHGYTRYGAWFGDPYGDWCAMFASFCLHYAGVPQASVPYASGCIYWVEQLKNAGLYESAADCYPEPGFLVFFDTDSDGLADHVGVVTDFDGETISTVEGNIGGAVVQRGYSESDSTILGYCLLPENPNTQKDETASDAAISNDAIMPAAVLPDDVVDSGTFESAEGKELTWTVTQNAAGEYTLTIDGEGAMPDYSGSTLTDRPWAQYSSTSLHLVIGDGITRIGACSFSGFRITELLIGSGVDTIGSNAFSYTSQLKEVNIPGNVKKIGGDAFAYSRSIVKLTFHEGTETIEATAFRFSSNDAVEEVYIPASVTYIAGGAFNSVIRFVVAEDSSSFATDENGVLYTKGMDELVCFTGGRPVAVYRIPDTVSTIRVSALSNNNSIDKLIIPASVTSIPGGGAFGYVSSYKEIYFEDGSQIGTIGDYIFYNIPNLTSLHLPEHTPLKLGAFGLGDAWYSLTSLDIPDGVTEFTSNIASKGGMLGLESLRYNAANATFGTAANNICGTDAWFALTIGKDVDTLAEKFSYFTEHATSIAFEKSNQITITEGAFANASAPFTGLSGTVYVDEQGVLYSYDASAGTAEVVYVPADVTDVTIPAAITPEEGVTVNVTSVGANALSLAEKLKSITFEAPSAITEIGAYGLGNCPSLSSVNGETTVEAAKALFSSAKQGYGIFDNTNLTGSSGGGTSEEEMTGDKGLVVSRTGATEMSISVSSKGETLAWKENGEKGGYTLLTGDTMTVTASVGNTEGAADFVYRLYVRKGSDDCSLSITPGGSYTFDGITATCYATEDPNTVCLEFRPVTGKTLSIPVTAVYPSPASKGGTARVWGEILTEAEAEDKTTLRTPDAAIDAVWKTQPDDYTLIKAAGSQSDAYITGDENGNAIPNENLVWYVRLDRAEETSSAYGKDLVRSVDYTDELTLPEGLHWTEEVLQAVKDGDTRRSGNDIYAGDVKIASITCSNLRRSTVTLSDDGTNLVFAWSVSNTSRTADLGSVSATVTIYREALYADLETFPADAGAEIQNIANATMHYTYSADRKLGASATRTIKLQTGTLTLKKSASGGTYFGEDITYTVTLQNTGALPYTTDAAELSVRDTLSVYSYISPENMEKMFSDEYGGSLSITISNATLAPWQEVTATDGTTTSYQTSGNSNLGESGKILTITKSGDSYAVSVTNGGEYTGATPAEALQNAGYAVTKEATYECKWVVGQSEGDSLTIPGGQLYTYTVYAAAKDSFGILPQDRLVEYPSGNPVTITNYARLYSKTAAGANQQLKVAGASTRAIREAQLVKSVYDAGGHYLGSAPTAADGDVLNYQLDFTHYGAGEYDDLPMVDDLCGSQYLMVLKEKNPELADKGLTEKEYQGDTYYILTEGSYKNIVVGMDDEGNWLTAASITVEKADTETQTVGGSYTGIHTQIKWYFAHLDGGNYRKTVRYQAVVDLSTAGVSYTIGNIGWMNDRTDSRLYDPLWGGGAMIYSDKEILETRGASPSADVVNKDDYSTIGEGGQVTYRLTLRNETGSGANNQLSGQDFTDALPETYDIFQWAKGENITVEWETVGDVEATGLDDWSIVPGDETGIGLVAGRQCLAWADDTQISFHGEGALYLYVTLTFPEDTEGGGETWSEYTAANGGCQIDNTLYVYRFPSTVLHDLREGGQVALQKGVLALTRTNNGAARYASGSDRQHYANADYYQRSVLYYVTLYNGGNKRLYLSDLQDQLPKGFQYNSLLTDLDLTKETWSYNNTSSIVTKSGLSYSNVGITDLNSGTNIVFRSASVGAKPSADKQSVTFSLSAGSGSLSLKYDETRKQYYLDRGEAVAFVYEALVGDVDATDDSALNTIGMPYTDHLGSGVTQLSRDVVPIMAATGGRFQDQNNGTRQVLTAENAVQAGFNVTGNEKWLVSGVTMQRGGIVPGVTKYTESYTNEGGVTTAYTSSVAPNDTINWRIRVQNTGTTTMTNYTVTDVMPNPYAFTGTVHCKIYDSVGTVLQDRDLFSYRETRTGEETTVAIYNSLSNTYITVPMDGTSVSLNTRDYASSVAMSRDKAGNEILTINFTSNIFSIPEGGYMDVTCSSVNPTNDYVNSVYINRVQVTPNYQTFTEIGQGSAVYDENGSKTGVQNSSPATVSFGYATSSEKSVVETDDAENSASSTNMDKNTIVLSDAANTFRYTLTVNNDTDEAMTKLVFIDNLPEVGDHSPFDTTAVRSSEFDVRFADDPDVVVNITTQDGTITPLASQYYTVEYSTQTDFEGPQSRDWKGEDTGKWTSSSADARSLRIVITDEGRTQIPAKSTVEVSFTAAAKSNAQPGKVAWNSFGYHYALGDKAELEAMPLVVGVKIPSVPTLKKQLVDDRNEPVKAETDETFRFLIYEGEALSGYDTEDALKAALDKAGRKYMETELTVEAGASESEALTLLPNDAFEWTEGKQYTAIELTAVTERYHLSGFTGGDKTMTFTYHAASDTALVCRNTLWQWAIRLTKVDLTDGTKTLPGAVFALYSPNEEEQLQETPAEYSELGIQMEITAEDTTWYLCSVQTTGTDGTISWEKLGQEQYFLLEVKAPDGYNLPKEPGQVLTRDSAAQGVCSVTVQNTPGYALPKTGGAGTLLFTIGGTLLLAGSLLLGYVLRRKRERRFMR